MKPGVIFLTLVVVLGGCASRNLSLPRNEAAAACCHRVLVVAMEPPPLMVPPRFESAILGTLPKYPIQAARVGGVVASVAILAEMPAAARRSAAASRRLKELLSREGPWEPTMILAREAAARLSASGQRQVTVNPKIQPILGLADRHNPLTKNWHGPIRTWYIQAETSAPFQAEAEAKTDAVVEIAILNYEINPDNQMNLQVLVKVVDPATGQVTGRARGGERFAVGPPDQAVTHNLQQLKDIFAQKGKDLVTRCLTEAGLL
jgi:hypothetical protein